MTIVLLIKRSTWTLHLSIDVQGHMLLLLKSIGILMYFLICGIKKTELFLRFISMSLSINSVGDTRSSSQIHKKHIKNTNEMSGLKNNKFKHYYFFEDWQRLICLSTVRFSCFNILIHLFNVPLILVFDLLPAQLHCSSD